MEKYEGHCPTCEQLGGPCLPLNLCCRCIQNQILDEIFEEEEGGENHDSNIRL
jgi:hypothetical protein